MSDFFAVADLLLKGGALLVAGKSAYDAAKRNQREKSEYEERKTATLKKLQEGLDSQVEKQEKERKA
jgi:hypothetical protein